MKLSCTLILGLCHFLLVSNALSQRTSIEDLRLKVEAEENDTVRINLLNKIADELIFRDMKAAIKLCDSIIVLSTDIPYMPGKIDALQSKGFLYAISGRSEKSIGFLLEAEELLEKHPNDKRRSNVLYALGVAHVQNGDFNTALPHFLEAHDIKLRAGNTEDLIKSYNGLANLYASNGDYAKTLESFTKAYELSQTIDNVRLKLLPLFGLGGFYSAQGEFSKALGYQLEAEKLSTIGGTPDGRAKILASIGGTYLRLGEFEKAAEYYEQGLEILLQIGQRNVISTTLRDMALVQGHLGNQQKVFKLLRQALAVYDGDEPDCKIMHVYTTLGGNYIKVGRLDSAGYYANLAMETATRCKEPYTTVLALKGMGRFAVATGNKDDAIEHYTEAYDIAKDKSYLNIQSEVAGKLSKLYEEQRDYKTALAFHRTFQTTKDSIFNKENTQKITRLESQFEYEKEKEILLAEQKQQELILEEKIRTQRVVQYSIFGGAVLLLMLSVNFYRSYRAKKRDNELLEEKNTKILSQASELKLTNEQLMELSNFKEGLTQMIAHDMKNPLNVIIGLSDGNKENKQLKSIHQSGKQMLNMVTNMLDIQRFEQAEIELNATKVSLKSLVQEALYQVELLAHARRITLEVDHISDVTVECNNDMMVRVLVNLLTNSIKYSSLDGHIILSSETDEHNHQALIRVADHGSGISEEELPHIFEKFWQVRARDAGNARSTGLGLTYCKMAVEAHGCTIEATSKVGMGTTFSFGVPLSTEDVITSPEAIEGIVNEGPVILDTEVLTLKSYALHLRKLKVYQASEINNIIDQMEKQKLQSHWKEALKVAVYNCDKEKFEALVSMI